MSDVIVERPETHIALVRLNRPKALNALSPELMKELFETLADLDSSNDATNDATNGVRCVVLTGNEKAFAAGADIGAMATASFAEVYRSQFLDYFDRIATVRIPIIAAVSGWCLGGGCELAMLCDIAIASDTAKFGQPEIKIGVIPGAGGTQRLTNALGKSRAMEMILTGEPIQAQEALERGLVSRVVPAEQLLDESLSVARKIVAMPPIAVQLAKDSVNRAYETSLTEGVRAERRNFLALFSTEDRAEGMAAFMEKRAPNFTGN